MKIKKRHITLAGVLILIIILSLSRSKNIPAHLIIDKYCNHESEFVEVEKINVHFRREGEGEKLLLLHGTASSLHTWDAYTEALKDSFEVIRLDLPAFGVTGPFQNADYSIDHYVRFLNAFANAIQIDTFTIIGNSLGGQIALAYALQYPDKVNKLVLIDPSGAPPKRSEALVFKLARIPVVNLFLKWITPRSFIKNNLQQVYYDDSRINDELIDRYYAMTLREGNRQAFIDRAKTPRHKFSHDDLNIQLPTLIMWGKEDTWIDYSAAKFFLTLPNSEFALIEKCGHVPMEECPDTSLPYLTNFLNR